VRRRGQLGDQPLERGAVLARQRRAQRASPLRVGLGFLEQPAEEIRKPSTAIAITSTSASGLSSPTSSTPAW